MKIADNFREAKPDLRACSSVTAKVLSPLSTDPNRTAIKGGLLKIRHRS